MKFLFKVFCVLLFGGVCVGLGAVAFSKIGEEVITETKTHRLGLKDIGELATQEAVVTEVNSITKPVIVFDKYNIPFAESKYVYSCDFIVKAGFIVDDIYPKFDEVNKKVYVTLPEPQILSNEPILENEITYHEDEKLFNQFTMEERNQAFIKLKKSAQNSAIENGLLDKSKENAATIIESFFAEQYPSGEYKYIYKYV